MTDQQNADITKINNRHIRFIDEYFINNMNATEAYLAVYPKVNRDTAGVNGCRLLGNANIKAEISRRMRENGMQPEEIVSRLSDMARASHLPFISITDSGTVYFDFSNPEAKKYFHLIKKIKTKRTRRLVGHGDNAEEWEDEWVEVELYDAQNALLTLAKLNGMVTEKTDITSKGEKLEQSQVLFYIPCNNRDDHKTNE